MNFITPVPIAQSAHPINYDSQIVALGSCFAENMGVQFGYFKFQHTVNPFGIVFNPVSIEKLVSRMVHKQLFTEKDIFFHNGLWHCFEVHSVVSHPVKEQFLSNLNALLDSSHRQIMEASHLIITYGTAWVYALKATAAIVANCHKVPQNQFDKQLLSVEIIEKAIRNTTALVRQINPDCRFIFTVSPVRHIKDGFVENNVSKSHLLAALYQAEVNYFPSYEIMVDELRDYRFYADDMLHPSPLAITYIWERFCQTQMEHTVFPVMDAVDAIQKALQHKPFHPDSESHQQFLDKLNQKIITLTKQFPQIQF